MDEMLKALNEQLENTKAAHQELLNRKAPLSREDYKQMFELTQLESELEQQIAQAKGK